MSLPAGYSQDNDGWYWYNDGTGPYSRAPGTDVMTLLSGALVTASPSGFTQGQNGLYYGTDQSGPYTKGSGGIYKFIG